MDELILLEGNRPLLLKEPESLYLIEDGAVDIFAVPVVNGEAGGPRTYLFRLEKGEAILGSGLFNEKMGFLAVGIQGTKVLKKDLNDFLKENPDRAEKIIISWVTKLINSIVPSRKKPRKIDNIDGKREIICKKGKILGIEKGTKWIKVDEGALKIEEKHFPLLKTGENFPITERLWLKAQEKKNCITVLSIEEVLRNYIEFLPKFQEKALEILEAKFKELEKEEKARLEERKIYDKKIITESFSKIASIIGRKKVEKFQYAGKDPLIACCFIIADQMGITIKEPNFSLPLDPVMALQDIARISGFRFRKVALRGDWWKKEVGPLLGFTKKGKKPVALIPNGFRGYKYYIPQDNLTGRVDKKFAEELEFFAYMFYRPLPLEPVTGKKLLKFGFKDCKKDFMIFLGIALTGAILSLLLPIMTGIVFNDIIPEAAYNQLFQIGFILLCVALATGLFEITKGIALLRLEGKMNSSIQAAIWDRLLSLPVPFFRKFTAGDLAQRSMSINYLRQLLSTSVVSLLISAIFSSVNIILLFYYEWKLAILAIVLSSIGIGISIVLTYLQVKYQKEITNLNGKESGTVLQFLTAIPKIKITGTENRAFNVWANIFSQKKELSYKAGLLGSLLASFSASFPVLVSMGIFAWVIMKRSSISTGNFIAFSSAFLNFQNAFMQVVPVIGSLVNAAPLYERVKPILVVTPEIDEKKASPGELEGAIEVKHVYFRYDPDGPYILKDVSLYANPGEFIAIVGDSGSGKTTLFRLLLGFEFPEQGTIYYDGQDLASLDIKEVRRQIGVVLQNGKLMPDSIFKNIIGSSNLTIEDAWEAAKMVGLDEDIKNMPMGMHTIISPGGGNLSGGQRQRILIARAIVKKPKILFFDEATSALDNRTQEIVSKSIEKLNATRIVIAHRLSTIINADRIYVLQKGEIKECGTYEELMKKNGIFAKLAKRQIA